MLLLRASFPAAMFRALRSTVVQQAKRIMAIMDFPSRQHAREVAIATRRPAFSEFDVAFGDRPPTADATSHATISLVFAPIFYTPPAPANDTQTAPIISGFAYLTFGWMEVGPPPLLVRQIITPPCADHRRIPRQWQCLRLRR